jgi:hypothetical protein
MPICASASFASPVPCAASAARRVKRCSAMSSVCCSTPDAFGKPQLLQRLDADPDLVRSLADRIRRRDGAIDQRAEAAGRRSADQRAAKGANAGAQQLGLAAETLQPARGAIARALDALQALLAALAD